MLNWTTRKLLNWTTDYLADKGVEAPRIAAEMLLGHVLEVSRIRLYTDLDRPASPLERAAFRDLVEQAAAHTPVQYLVGRAHFFSLVFVVDRRVLVPRPSTETLVEYIIQHGRRTPGHAMPTIADIGTGSGCIAIALAKHLPEAHLLATDLSDDALALARTNAETHGVIDRIEFARGEGYAPLVDRRFDILVSNPPYISDAEWAQVPPNVKDHEPTVALRAGPDGLDVLRPLIAGAPRHLETGGSLVFEIAASQKQAVIALVETTPGLRDARVLADAEGHPRMLLAEAER